MAINSVQQQLPLSIAERISSFDRALTASELSSIVGVTAALVYKQARVGVIPCFRIGTSVRFDPRAVCEWLKRQ